MIVTIKEYSNPPFYCTFLKFNFALIFVYDPFHNFLSGIDPRSKLKTFVEFFHAALSESCFDVEDVFHPTLRGDQGVLIRLFT